MSGPRKQDFRSIIGKLHEEHFGSEEDQRIAKKLAEERATANAELAYRYANLAMPEDIRRRAKAWGMETFCEVLWNNAFQAGFREVTRTPDAAQIRADALREAIWAAFKAGVGQGSEEATSYEWGTAPQQSRQQAFDDFMADWNEDSAYLRALLDTPLSPPAVDGSPAPDAGGKEGV